MNAKLLLTSLVWAASSTLLLAQKIQIIEGDLKLLKGQTVINIETAFDNMLVGAQIPEGTFVATKMEAWEAKEPGKGPAWKAMWFGEQEKNYKNIFGHYLFKESGLTVKENVAPFTLILKTTHMEPGWTIGVMGGVASISGEVWIVDSNDKSNVLVKISFTNIKGLDHSGGDFEMGRRIQGAYLNAGKQIGAFIKRRIN
ncbi:MAG: hypothetical protein ACOYXT_29885 [Bacteroidota bacterium]